MDSSATLCERIRQLRLLRGYSQEYVSIQLDTSLRQYQRLEYGTKDWKLDELFKVADVLEIPLHLIFNFDLAVVPDLVENEILSKNIMDQLDEIKSIISELRKKNK